jgi:hypothetical protein
MFPPKLCCQSCDPSMNLKVMLDNQLKPIWMWNLSSGSFVFPSDCQGRDPKNMMHKIKAVIN